MEGGPPELPGRPHGAGEPRRGGAAGKPACAPREMAAAGTSVPGTGAGLQAGSSSFSGLRSLVRRSLLEPQCIHRGCVRSFVGHCLSPEPLLIGRVASSRWTSRSSDGSRCSRTCTTERWSGSPSSRPSSRSPPDGSSSRWVSPGSGMFVLEEGTVEVQTPDGRSWELGVGEFFGSSRSSPMIRGRLASGRRRRCGASRSPGATSRNCSRRSLRSPWRCCRGSPSGSMLPTERA